MVPDAKSEETRTVSVSRPILLATLITAFLLLVGLILAGIMYTPIGTHLAAQNPELVRQYGNQIADIQKQLNLLVQEIDVLRAYNVRLRKALGESLPDSLVAAARQVDSTLAQRSFSKTLAGPSTPPATAPSVSTGGFAKATPAAQQNNEGFVKNLPMIAPTDGFVSRKFQPDQLHYGVDLSAREGTPVIASADGNVVFADWSYDDGFTIVVAHEEGFTTVYKHNKSLMKRSGEVVRRGELIALLGNTGKSSSGPHLHFEVWKDGVAQDPNNYLLNVQ